MVGKCRQNVVLHKIVMIFLLADRFICMLRKPGLLEIYVYEHWGGWVYLKGNRKLKFF